MSEEQSQPQSENPPPAAPKSPLDQRLVQVARVLVVTKQQVERLTEAVTELTSRQQHLDDLSTQLHERIGGLHGQLGATTDELGQRIADAMGDLDLQRQGSEDARQYASELLERATSTGERLAGVQSELSGKIDKLQGDMDQALAAIESTTEEAARANSMLDEQVFALKGRVTAFAQGVEQWFKPAQSEIEANRQFVERAAEQIRERLEGFDEAARDLEQRVQGGLAELNKRNESRDAIIDAMGSSLESKLDACLERLARHPERTSELALDRFRPLIDELMTHVSNTCLGEADLGDHVRSLQAQFESAIAGIEERLTPALAKLATRLDAVDVTATETRDNCRAVQQQLGGATAQLEKRIFAVQESLDTALGATLEQKLAGFGERLDAVAEQMAGRVSQTLSDLDERSRTSADDAAARQEELAKGQQSLAGGLDRLEAQVAKTLTTSGDQTRSLVSLRDRIDSVSEQVDECVTRNLSGFDERNRQAIEDAVAVRKELIGGQRELGMAIIRLERLVSDSLAAYGEHRTRDEENSTIVINDMRDVRDQMAAVSSELAERISPVLAELQMRSPESEAINAQLAEGRNQLNAAFSRFQGQVAETLAGLDARFDSTAEQVGRRVSETLAESQAGLNTTLRRVEDLATQALTDLGSVNSEEHERITGVKDQVSRLSEQLAAVGDRLDDAAEQMGRQVSEKVEGSRNELDTALEPVVAMLQEQQHARDKADTILEQELTDLRTRLADVSTALVELRERPSSDRRHTMEHEQIATMARQLGDLHEQLTAMRSLVEAVPGQLDQHVSAALAGLSDRPASDHKQLASVQEQLIDLRDQLVMVSTQVESVTAVVDRRVSEALAQVGSLQSEEPDLSEFKAQVEAMTAEVGTQVSQALAELQVPGPAAEGQGQDSKQLGAMVIRLEERVTTALDELAGRVPHDRKQIDGMQRQLVAVGEQVAAVLDRQFELRPVADAPGDGARDDNSSRLDQQFDGLRQQLATLGERLGSLENSLGEMEFAVRPDNADAPGLDDKLEELQTQISAATEKMDTRLADVVSAMKASHAQPPGATTAPATAPKRPRPATNRKNLTPDQFVKSLIDAINSGKPDTIRDFVIDEYAESALDERGVHTRVDVYMSVYEELGESRLIDLQVNSTTEIIAIVQSTHSMTRQRFEIVLERAEPHKILVVNIDAI